MKRVLMTLLVIVLLTANASATEGTIPHHDILDTNELIQGAPEEVRDYMDTTSTWKDILPRIQSILASALKKSGTALKSSGRTVAVLLTIVIFCSLAKNIVPSKNQGVLSLVGACAILLTFVSDLNSMIAIGKETIEEISAFSKILIPAMVGAVSATGAITSATALYSGSIFFFQILISGFAGIVVPLIYAYIALATMDTALKQETFTGIKKFIGSTIKTVLKISLFVFTTYLSLTGLISGSADALTLKAAKLTISSAVPVVGSMISDASETVIVSAKLLQNSVGIFGMLSAISIVALPFLRLGIHYLFLQLACCLSAVFGPTECGKLIGDISSAMGYLLASVGTGGLMLFISCICFMKVNVI